MKRSPFVCDMSAIDPSMRKAHIQKINKVFQSVKEIRETPDGFAFLFGNESQVLINLMAFIEKERLCCPFFGFNIEIEPEGGKVWLKINGLEGVKEFITAEFGEHVPENISIWHNSGS